MELTPTPVSEKNEKNIPDPERTYELSTKERPLSPRPNAYLKMKT